ncbi:MAG: hypothetical protein IPK15_27340 [Verrucomicrobia bacterium]|nr:hypothetical protein [Verrucomicrobiota bacterium]
MNWFAVKKKEMRGSKLEMRFTSFRHSALGSFGPSFARTLSTGMLPGQRLAGCGSVFSRAEYDIEPVQGFR